MKHRLVDKILDWRPFQEIRGLKAVSFEEYKLKAAFGEDARLPESLLLESLFQIGNWLVVLSSDYRQIGIVKEFESVRFSGLLRPGGRLTMELQVKQHDAQCLRYDAHGSSGTKDVVQVENCVVELVELADYHDSDDLRVLYSEIGPVTPDYSLKNHSLP
jgi:3-hydroxymyristoyl/3-hydroxydecanoyl-(acyl carrier protein) dehydratase